ncbi:MAG: Smr/MutS family protein [Deltaproteobacteria bacterium]|nr:Smr/MutS family protein [Deltaproteobacteria bacterium]
MRPHRPEPDPPAQPPAQPRRARAEDRRARRSGKGFIPGIVHGTSGSGQTLFIEPQEIVELNNRKRLAECDVADEERRIYVKFSGWIAEEAPAFDAGLAIAEALDVIAAGARLAEDLVASEAIIDDAPRIALLHARHPLMLLANRRCVANDITVAAGVTLLVSGPNAGGKTVALKACGLAALMTRAGLHLAAESGSVMGWFPDVRADIGDAQSLEANLSTFSGHVVALRDYLATAGPGTLLLVDEIAVGTDPEQGAALAQAVLEALAGCGITGIVTTHYDRLKAVGATDPRFANASVGFDLSRMEPTFKLHLGVPGSSGALAVARRHGHAANDVARAQERLGGQATKVEELLANVSEQRRRIEEERAVLLDELERTEADRVAFRAENEPKRPTPPGRVPKEGDLVIGTPVIVKSVGGRGHVASLPDKGSVDVRLGGMRIAVEVGDLLLDSHRAARAAAQVLPPGPPPEVAIALAAANEQKSGARTPESTIDVRGARADEAIAMLDRFIDEGMLVDRDIVFVIHGHGTGALRTAVRAHAAQHQGIEKWRAGEREEGGDGVTVMWLKS